jgi:hypothetical protein
MDDVFVSVLKRACVCLIKVLLRYLKGIYRVQGSYTGYRGAIQGSYTGYRVAIQGTGELYRGAIQGSDRIFLTF